VSADWTEERGARYERQATRGSRRAKGARRRLD
jgi:hypothetical protein